MSLEVGATVRKDSYGATWEVSTGIDLTDTSAVQLRIRDEAGNIGTVTGSVKSPATDGIIQWTEPAAYWDEVGFWRMEAVATFSGAVRYGNPVLIRVREDING